MGFWEKSVRIFNYLGEAGTQSVRRLAQHTGVSKSSAHRLTQAMMHRDIHPESWLWETAEGRRWLTRLVVATLYTFGLKRGVGLDTISEFFSRLHLEMQLGSSPGALRGVMQALERAIMETGHAWEQAAIADGEGLEIIGAVDETFLERMLLVFLALPTGYLLLEEAVEDRSYATWKALVDKRLEALRAPVRYLVSDRAKALIQLADQGLECLRIPAVFHLVHDIVKSYSLTIGRQLRRARQEWQKAQDGLQRPQEREPRSPVASREATRQGEAAQADVRRWETVQSEYRQRLETLSLTLHPFRIDDSTPQTSAQVESQVHTQIEAIEALGPHPAGAGASGSYEEGQKTGPRPRGARGLLVGRSAAGLGLCWRLSPMAVVGARGPATTGVWGVPSDPDAVHPQESQEATGTGDRQSRGCHACAHPMPTPAGPWGVARMGHSAGAGLSACLLSRRRPQRLSGAAAPQSAGLAQAAL